VHLAHFEVQSAVVVFVLCWFAIFCCVIVPCSAPPLRSRSNVDRKRSFLIEALSLLQWYLFERRFIKLFSNLKKKIVSFYFRQ
jgi:hypothetical protein